jgi:hypothetical protein
MAVIPVCRTQALEGAWMPWAAEDEPRRAAVAVWGEPRQSVPVRRRQGRLRKHEIAADDSFKAELTTRLLGKSFPSLPGRFHVV